jgi:hypothetical protein
MFTQGFGLCYNLSTIHSIQAAFVSNGVQLGKMNKTGLYLENRIGFYGTIESWDC